jgi:hypothetical protein
MEIGLRDGRGSRKAERLTESATPNHLIRTIPAKGDHPVGPTRLPDPGDRIGDDGGDRTRGDQTVSEVPIPAMS